MHIVIIDNDPLYSWIVKKFVEREHPAAKIDTFTNAEEALRKIVNDSFSPDLIILDWEMPFMDGYTFAYTYAQIPVNHVPVIVLTNSVYESDRQKASGIPIIKGYFMKPISMNMVKKMLDFAVLEKS